MAVEVFPVRLVPAQQGYPALLVNERAYVECGCTCAVGRRLDNNEPALALFPCGEPGHGDVMAYLQAIYVASLGKPEYGDRLGVDVADEIMQQLHWP